METWKDSTTIAQWLTMGVLVVIIMATMIIKLSHSSIAQRAKWRKNRQELSHLHSTELIRLELDTLEKERLRIANDLHDDLIGQLHQIRLANLLKPDFSVDMVLEESIALTRRISHDLAPSMLEYKSITTVIQEVIDPWKDVFDFRIELCKPKKDFEPNMKLHINRCLKELIQNTYRHANAAEIEISTSNQNDDYIIEMKDFGEGFCMNGVQKGLGIESIEARMNSIGGKVEWESVIGEGTRVKLYLS